MKYNYGDWNPIVEDFKKVENLSTKPDRTKFPKYKMNAVIDEDKSVRWNNEEIERRNAAFKKEASRLQTVKSHEYNKVINAIVDIVTNELITSGLFKNEAIAKEKAYKIYNKAYDESHSYGIYDVLVKIDDYIDFITEIMK